MEPKAEGSEPAESPQAEAAQPEVVQPDAPVAEKRPARRRATRSTAAAAPSEAPSSPAETATEAVESAPEAQPVQAEAPAPVEAPAESAQPARRRRATRKAAAPEAAPTAEATVAPEADAEPEPEPQREPAALGRGRQSRALGRRAEARAIESTPTPEVAEEAEAPQEEAAAPREETPREEAAPRGRRRRVSRPAAAPERRGTAADPDEDPIAAALRAAEEIAEARKAVLSDPFMTAAARDAQLAALAGAIAADSALAETADDEAEDEDEDEDDEETVDTEADTDTDESETQDDETSDDDSDEESDEDSADDDRPTRRRRRRGGRRRRRGGRADSEGDDDSSDESDDDDTDAADSDEHADSPESADDADGEGVTVRRRRRRRRRNGESSGETGHEDEVTGIEGSTRMEAKRQRRKESRAAGRRRAPILSEAEFLARREQVDRKLVIRQSEDYTQLAVVEDGILVEHYVDKASAASLIGNVYVGKVQNVLPSMEAAFIDIGRGRNAVLYAGEVDWDAFQVSGENRKVENVLKSGQSVLVQVTKDPVGAKGARLTGHISLPGRYIVYSPGGHLSGISRKLPDTERNRLRGILSSLISDNESVIVRTAAEGIPEDELVRDVNRLKAQWEVIEKASKKGSAPQALYSEPDLTLRIVRDLFTEDFGQLIVQGDGGPEDSYDAIAAYVSHVAPHLAERLERFEVGDDGKDIFAKFKIDEQIAKALDRKVFLPSGGSLVIDRTEAMTVIDVNTGRFTGAGGNLEATVTSNNLEAAEEIVRQLRLRDLGGMIVIDFIDMVLPSNRDLLLRRLVECLSRDRTRHQVSEVTSLGLVQLTRKRIGTGLQEAFTEPCEHCDGAGYHRFEEPVDSQAPSDGGERKGGSGRRRGGRGR
ncbi:Rne/Rng family ribonuclease [Tessaracoccus sp. ZS01]|uniref:Rne/Rng family ribonuclease n=1 Tax=Tessaracoccus sp. ZS01 TaxID=1906324 RepID=UPI0009FA10A7|nr:Rne/Rng family ribonuclease [Tessaracoccus sp. ZS01]MCG6567991.1 ribonuclease [Tessaracoccus sp. ZS01]